MADQIKLIFSQTLTPDASIRKNAEKALKDASKHPGHSLQVLQVVATSNTPQESAIRQAAAVHFKNLVKKGWDTESEDGNDGITISPEDRVTIKNHLVELMCTVPLQIQAQVSEAISLIAKVDYPKKWDNLLDQLIRQFSSTDPAVVNGVLKTANGICKSFRYVQRCDELYEVIKYTLDRIQAPLLQLFIETGKAVDTYANDAANLAPRLEALRTMSRIFFSLNYQDLPEFFEDHMQEWMTEFSKYLIYKNPVVTDDDEDTEPGPIDKLQAAIIENLELYTDKDEEPFLDGGFLPEFTKLVWNLLMGISDKPKHDILATTSIKFLSGLLSKLMHKNLFEADSTLGEIVMKIVIPNLKFRECDEELFEDDPKEYILTEVEGSDSESRRRCSQDLLRAMCRHFEEKTTQICIGHIQTMLAKYSSDPNNNWREKDAAIHLMLGIAVRKESSLGVSETNPGVNIMDFFTSHILTDLQDTNHTSQPVVKATALKFVTTFRNQFSKEELIQLFPMIIAQMGSLIVVVHTFATYSIERILTTKEGSTKQFKFGRAELQPFLMPLFTSLFGIVDNADLDENDYVMKCIMRVLCIADEDVVPITQTVIEKLTAALERIAKNPRNPQFNHFLFESIAVLVRAVCSKNPTATDALEGLLFPPFQAILQNDILEFTPYVFQVMAQLLEFRSCEGGLGPYENLFAPLLTASLWERKGNIPALNRLVIAYYMKASPHLIQGGFLQGTLGCFQKMLSIPVTEGDAFNLVNALFMYVPTSAMQQYNQTVFSLLLTKLQAVKGRSEHKYNKFAGYAIRFFAMFVAKYDAAAFMSTFDGIQPGLGVNLTSQVWLKKVLGDAPKGLDAKLQIIGLTKLLKETPVDNAQIWCATFSCISKLLASISLAADTEAVDVEDLLMGDVQYDSNYSRLVNAKKQAVDPVPEVADPAAYVAQIVQQISNSNPGRLTLLVQESLKDDAKLAQGVSSIFQKAGIQLS